MFIISNTKHSFRGAKQSVALNILVFSSVVIQVRRKVRTAITYHNAASEKQARISIVQTGNLMINEGLKIFRSK